MYSRSPALHALQNITTGRSSRSFGNIFIKVIPADRIQNDVIKNIIAMIIIIRDESLNFGESSKFDQIVFGGCFFLTCIFKLVSSSVYAEYDLALRS